MHKDFFQVEKSYRVPGFLATSLDINTALRFIRRSDKKNPRILWCILVGTLKDYFRHETVMYNFISVDD